MRRRKEGDDSPDDEEDSCRQGELNKRIKPLQFVQADKTDIELRGGGRTFAPPKEVTTQIQHEISTITSDEEEAFFPASLRPL